MQLRSKALLVPLKLATSFNSEGDKSTKDTNVLGNERKRPLRERHPGNGEEKVRVVPSKMAKFELPNQSKKGNECQNMSLNVASLQPHPRHSYMLRTRKRGNTDAYGEGTTKVKRVKVDDSPQQNETPLSRPVDDVPKGMDILKKALAGPSKPLDGLPQPLEGRKATQFTKRDVERVLFGEYVSKGGDNVYLADRFFFQLGRETNNEHLATLGPETLRLQDKAAEFMVYLVQRFNCSENALFLGLEMLRDITVHAKLSEGNHRLTALAIVMIACKAEEVHGPFVEDFLKCFVGLTLNELLNAEMMVLTLINFRISRPTVYDFTAYLWARAEMTDMMKELEKFICNVAATSDLCKTLKSSELGCGVVYVVAMVTQHKFKPEKDQALEFLCNGRLMKIVNILIDAINHVLTSNDAISFRLKDKFYQTHGVSPVKFINDNGSKLKRITI